MIKYEGLYLVYLLSAILFILAIKFLSSPKTARTGNNLGMIGMTVAVLTTLLILPAQNDFGILCAILLAAILGIFTANKVTLTALPQMIALLNGAGGLSSVMVGVAQMIRTQSHAFDVSIGIVVGGIAFSGSLIAFLKLQGYSFFKKIYFSHIINLILFVGFVFYWIKFAISGEILSAYLLISLTFLLGIFISLPIGGADMPILISVLNAFSGFAASSIGFLFSNVALIITGALVGASGTILAVIMTKAMNKNLIKIFFSSQTHTKEDQNSQKNVHTASIEDAAFLMQNASKIIIVPGFGMASSGAQYALKNMASILKNKYHVDVKFAIHPVAGRMPGHMNVLLAEAKVDYEKVFSLEDINPDFETADVAYVIGANDITNPAAKNDLSSPLYGMPILEVYKAKTVIFVKRSLSAGYSGAENPLFFAENTLMLYGDAKKVTEEIVTDL